jgi:Protein of unknown function (DUF3987)/Primase C terminal 2 (PriCT-2)
MTAAVELLVRPTPRGFVIVTIGWTRWRNWGRPGDVLDQFAVLNLARDIAAGGGGGSSSRLLPTGSPLRWMLLTVATNFTASPSIVPDLPTFARMVSTRRWLLSDPSKVPFYVNGRRRSGALDGSEDVAQLATYEEARAILESCGAGWRLGFALGSDGTGNHWQGIDFDKVEANQLADLANSAPGYVELSPSEKGAHAIGYGRYFSTLGSNGSGIEAYAGGRYFTVTECPIRDHGTVCLADWVENALAPRHHSARPAVPVNAKDVHVDPKTVTDLRSALRHMRADDRGLWVRMGMAVRELEEVGRGIWLDWSASSDKFDPHVAARTWDSFRPNATGYQAVFAEAQRHGWVNPASNAAQSATFAPSRAGDERAQNEDWPDPLPLPSSLLPVAKFDLALLPDPFRPWVDDMAERMQVPPEFVAVPAMVGAGSVIGNQIGIRPMREDDWQVVPNTWGCIVGRPGVLKSPSVSAALGPLQRLEAEANELFRREHAAWEARGFEREVRQEARKSAIKKTLSADLDADISNLRGEPEQEPLCRRYRSNDSSYQALGELLRKNPRGLLVHRDELMSLLSALDREDSSEARGFYMTGWNGNDDYVFDRIGRGTNLYIPQLTISVLGSTQPAKLGEYVRRILSGGANDDGMLQRFSMVVWPDMAKDWVEHDRRPNGTYRLRAFDAVVRLDRLDLAAIGAIEDDLNRGVPHVRFDPEAQQLFRAWRAHLEHRLRSEGLHPALESHLAKYRKLVPALALIHHLTSGKSGSVRLASIEAATGWAVFLESHAHRIYQSGAASDAAGAQAILRALRKGQLAPPFKARDVARKGWTPMGENGLRVQAAIDLLEDLHYLRGEDVHHGTKGGRPTTIYHANPKLFTLL